MKNVDVGRNKKGPKSGEQTKKHESDPYYKISALLVEFQIGRERRRLTYDIQQTYTKEKKVKGGSYTKLKSLDIECLFYLSIIPVQIHQT